MTSQRTVRDLFALATANSLDEQIKQGDTITVTDERQDRLREFGWITGDPEQADEGLVNVRATHTGAAILNYFSDCMNDGTLVSEVEAGVGQFVRNATRQQQLEIPVDDWEIKSMSENEVVLMADGIERRYRLAGEQIEA